MCSYKEALEVAEGVRHHAKGFAIQAAPWPSIKAPCFCSWWRFSSLLMQRVRPPPGEPAVQGTSATSLGSELLRGKNISRRTKTVITPCPDGDMKRSVRLLLSLATLSFHSDQCFRLLGLLVLSDPPNITRVFTGFKHFQVFTITSSPEGDLCTHCLLYCLWLSL